MALPLLSPILDGQPHTPDALPLGKLPTEVGWVQSQSGKYGEEKNILPLLGIKP
jgi:hypothetical protein